MRYKTKRYLLCFRFKQLELRYGFALNNIYWKSLREPMLYNHLLSKNVGTGKDKLVPEEVPIVNMKNIDRICYPDNAPEVRYF